jgi:hypothetical protein
MTGVSPRSVVDHASVGYAVEPGQPPEPSMPDALAVARALIDAAPPEMLRATLLALLDPAPDQPQPPPVAPARATRRTPPARPPATRAQPSTTRIRAQPASPAATGKRRQHPIDAEWDSLRHAVQVSMRERDLTWSALGAATGFGAQTLRTASRQRRAPSPTIQAALRSWLHSPAAHEVAATAAPFRRRANGTASPAA